MFSVFILVLQRCLVLFFFSRASVTEILKIGTRHPISLILLFCPVYSSGRDTPLLPLFYINLGPFTASQMIEK